MTDILIETQQIDNNVYYVYHNDSVVLSSCYSEFLKGLAASIENDEPQFGTPWYETKCGIIYVTDESSIIGYLAYADVSTGVLHLLNMRAGQPDIIRTLLSSFEKIAAGKQCWAIMAAIPNDNQSAIDAAHEIGLKDVYLQLCKKI